jgi:hypothetical protein
MKRRTMVKMLRVSSRMGFPGRAVAMAGVVALTGACAQAQEARTLAPHQHRPALIRHTHDNGAADSTNWSGYAVTGAIGSVTSVSGSWVVPAATCTEAGGSNAYAAFWVGIDGWNSSSVEQTGTDSDCSSGKPQYYAWYEFYPQNAYYAGTLTSLNPGDVISATVSFAGGKFTATITDLTKHESYTATYTPPAASRRSTPPARSSAEWITEAPCCTNRGGTLPLADFGTVSFGASDATLTTVSAGPLPIGSFGLNSSSTVWTSTMINQSTPKNEVTNPPAADIMALPSGLSNLSNFTVTWKSVGP